MKRSNKKDPNYDFFIGEITEISDDIEKYIKTKISEGLMTEQALAAIFDPMKDMRMRDQPIYLHFLEEREPGDEPFKAGIYMCKTDEAVIELVDKALERMPSEDQNAAFDSLHELNSEMTYCVLVKKIISREEMGTILTPMQQLDWKGKRAYADALIPIVKNGKSSKEILEKAKEAKGKLFPDGPDKQSK